MALNPAERRADAEAAIRRLEQERQDITSRLFGLAHDLQAAEAAARSAEAEVERIGTALAREMNRGDPARESRERFAAAQNAAVEARSALDRIVREDGECRRRLDRIGADLTAWAAVRDRVW